MRRLSRSIVPPAPADRPVRILQVGGGVFLRGFLDWMVDVANETGTFDGAVAVALSTDASFATRLRAQDGLFTVLVRGLREGRPVEERRIVRSVVDAFALQRDWDHACRVASGPALRAIVPNTTENGIVDVEEARPAPGEAPRSFPARLTALLHARWTALAGAPGSGVLVLPCELVEDNGTVLRDIVQGHASRWGLQPAFRAWLDTDTAFVSTLVDRIVPGFPRDEADALFAAWEYEDELAVAAEPFHLWAIEGDAAIRARLGLDAPHLGIVWTDDLRPWRDSKVRVLNGGHVAIALAAFLSGHDTVLDVMRDPRFETYLRRLLDRDVLPFVPLPPDERRRYADAVLERFANPFVRHRLLAISAGAVGKWRIRLLPSLLDQVGRDGTASALFAFSLASVLRFARGERAGDAWQGTRENGDRYEIRDDGGTLARIAAHRHDANGDPGAFVEAALSDDALWGRDLSRVPGLAGETARLLARIEVEGIAATLDDMT